MFTNVEDRQQEELMREAWTIHDSRCTLDRWHMGPCNPEDFHG